MPINAEGTLTITPEDIDCSRHFFGAFGRMEAEVAARWLVRFAQDRKQGWKPFTYDDIEMFYSRGGYEDFGFNGLAEDGWIVRTTENYLFTEGFIARCYSAGKR